MKGLRTTIYLVPDLDSAKEWYSDAFNSKPYFDEPFYVGFNIGGYELGLMPDESGEKRERVSNVRSYWAVDDIESSHKRLLELGAKELETPTNVGGELMVSSVFDPWGNCIGLIYNPYFNTETDQ
ncbi:MAG: VOC family protein [Bacteroidetes bacterium]|nr:VOC family protein [Bacteroidota bacterium]